MKTITYEREKIERIVELLDSIPFQGFDEIYAVAEIGKILDSGMLGEIIEKEGRNANDSNGTCKDDSTECMEQNIFQDKLEKSSFDSNSTE